VVEAERLTESARDQHARARAVDSDASDDGHDEALAIINATHDRPLFGSHSLEAMAQTDRTFRRREPWEL
jgi:hypothetical protein